MDLNELDETGRYLYWADKALMVDKRGRVDKSDPIVREKVYPVFGFNHNIVGDEFGENDEILDIPDGAALNINTGTVQWLNLGYDRIVAYLPNEVYGPKSYQDFKYIVDGKKMDFDDVVRLYSYDKNSGVIKKSVIVNEPTYRVLKPETVSKPNILVQILILSTILLAPLIIQENFSNISI